MKVAINTHPLISGHQVRGIGYYTRNLIKALDVKTDIQLQQFSDPLEVKDADIIHYPYFDLFKHSLKLKSGISSVVTIHDTTPLIFPNNYPKGLKGSYNLWLQKRALKKVDAVVTDSHNSKKDIIKYLHIKPDAVFVTPLAPAAHFKVIKNSQVLKSIEEKYNLPDKFLLYIGDVNWNKNISGMAEACLQSKMDLVVVGKSFNHSGDLEHIEQQPLKEFRKKYSKNRFIHTLGFVEDTDLVGILNLAQALLLVSYYEGFGLSILEAQSCGIAVITSNVSSLPEVAGDGAMYVNPYDTNEIANGIKKLFLDANLKKQLINKGFENVKRFSWDKTAEETIRAYEYAISKK